MPADPRLLDELLALALDLAAQAAAVQLEGLGRARAEVGTKSTATDMVTEVDRACEALIVGGLRAARPDDAIVGEEGTADDGTTGVRWLVDPVDGTTNYLYGIAGFSVSIAAEVDGARAVGVVHDVLHDDVFAAVAGRGATRNGATIRCSDKSDLPTALVATGFAYDPARRAKQAAVLQQLIPRIRDVRRMGAASVDLCSVACGRVDAYYEKGLGPWDLAAGALVASEAGARVGAFDGSAADGDTVLAAPAGLFEPLAELLRAAGADAA